MPAQLTASKQYTPRRSPLARASQGGVQHHAAAAPPGGPDYSVLLSADPVLNAAIRATTAHQVQQDADLAGARQRALIGYGAIPDEQILGGLGGDITDSTRGLANASTESGLSTTAQLKDAYKRQQSGDIGSLVGRNSLRSGDYKRLSRQNLQGYQTAQAGAQGQLLDTLSGYASTRAGQQAENVQGLQSATSDALTRIVGGINAGAYGSGTPGPTQAPPPTYSLARPPIHPGLPQHVSGTATVPRPTLGQARKKPLL